MSEREAHRCSTYGLPFFKILELVESGEVYAVFKKAYNELYAEIFLSRVCMNRLFTQVVLQRYKICLFLIDELPLAI